MFFTLSVPLLTLGLVAKRVNKFIRPVKRYPVDKCYLKGHCHEDFAVLGQFCAKIITLRLLS